MTRVVYVFPVTWSIFIIVERVVAIFLIGAILFVTEQSLRTLNGPLAHLIPSQILRQSDVASFLTQFHIDKI